MRTDKHEYTPGQPVGIKFIPVDESSTRLMAELLEALRDIHKLYLCPEPKTMRDWSARCDVMADYARKAIAKAEGREP